MASKATKELRELTDERLATRLRDAREALFNLRFQHASGALEETAEIGQRKREVARILTIVKEREETARG